MCGVEAGIPNRWVQRRPWAHHFSGKTRRALPPYTCRLSPTPPSTAT